MISEWKCADFSSISARSICISDGLRVLEGEKKLFCSESRSFVNRLSVVSWDLIYYLWNEAWHFCPFEVWINVLWSICLNFLSGLFLMETVITDFPSSDCFLYMFSAFIFVLCKWWNAHRSQAPVLWDGQPQMRRAGFCHQWLDFSLLDKSFNFINSFLELVKIFW